MPLNRELADYLDRGNDANAIEEIHTEFYRYPQELKRLLDLIDKHMKIAGGEKVDRLDFDHDNILGPWCLNVMV